MLNNNKLGRDDGNHQGRGQYKKGLIHFQGLQSSKLLITCFHVFYRVFSFLFFKELQRVYIFCKTSSFIGLYLAFHLILVTSLLVVFGDEVTKILSDSLFTFLLRQDRNLK